jgi:Nucleoside-diphosphate-sugar pyrophosphorylase involved in lipopolysaccharide biosynthesis/translation initiation factor 2B, gamma/epsilon subunits (eIF-2Bgamma/eIF-2Bepsilon)
VKTWKETIVPVTATIREAVKAIDLSSLGIALVVDAEQKLLGTVTDGDVRRGLLRAVSLDEPVTVVMNAHPTVAREFENRPSIIERMKAKHIRHIPIVDDEFRLVSLITLEELIHPTKQDNWVVLMAGGLGTRLRPLTEDCPKPLLKVGGKPLLETIIENFLSHGFHRFYISVNYKAEMVEEYFGNGEHLGAEIVYIKESKRMGTAGALSLLPEKPKNPLIVMNGDLLTKVNYNHLLQFHQEQDSTATMCVREFEYQIPYGVVRVDKHRLVTMEEKPVQKCFVNAGIYVLEPDVVNWIPKDEYIDMPELFTLIQNRGGQSSVFPIREYWLDIGRMDDFVRANDDFAEVFG